MSDNVKNAQEIPQGPVQAPWYEPLEKLRDTWAANPASTTSLDTLIILGHAGVGKAEAIKMTFPDL